MRISDVKKLGKGDQVFWNDPDGGACSRILNIKTIDVYPGGGVHICDDLGEVECYARELQAVPPAKRPTLRCSETMSKKLKKIHDAEVKQVLDFICKSPKVVDEQVLDELVQDTASRMASDANNGGFRAQVEFLLNNYGGTPEDIIKYLEENG